MVIKRLTATGVLKRLLGLLVALIFMLMLTSCGADEMADSVPQQDDWSWEGQCC